MDTAPRPPILAAFVTLVQAYALVLGHRAADAPRKASAAMDAFTLAADVFVTSFGLGPSTPTAVWLLIEDTVGDLPPHAGPGSGREAAAAARHARDFAMASALEDFLTVETAHGPRGPKGETAAAAYASVQAFLDA